jgi:hypothetical protein
MKMGDSPLSKGAKALRPWGMSCWRLAALAHRTTPEAFGFSSLIKGGFQKNYIFKRRL